MNSKFQITFEEQHFASVKSNFFEVNSFLRIRMGVLRNYFFGICRLNL
jgi:hypothetical protein